jgi:hypothetical protein
MTWGVVRRLRSASPIGTIAGGLTGMVAARAAALLCCRRERPITRHISACRAPGQRQGAPRAVRCVCCMPCRREFSLACKELHTGLEDVDVNALFLDIDADGSGHLDWLVGGGALARS